jgi:hypothetical protein
MIKKYLTFNINYTKKESDYLDNFNITNVSGFDHYGNIDNLDDHKLNDFLTKIGPNENINILNKIIYKLADKVTNSYETKYCWLTIIVKLPNHDFDIPRWHKDASFKSEKNLYKFITVLQGPGTIFIKQSNKVDEIYNKNNDDKQKSYKKLGVTIYNDKIENKYRKKLANKLEHFKYYQVKPKQGLIFLVGTDKNNDLHGLLHSEPKMDRSRIFISIITGSKNQIMELQKRPSI